MALCVLAPRLCASCLVGIIMQMDVAAIGALYYAVKSSNMFPALMTGYAITALGGIFFIGTAINHYGLLKICKVRAHKKRNRKASEAERVISPAVMDNLHNPVIVVSANNESPSGELS